MIVLDPAELPPDAFLVAVHGPEDRNGRTRFTASWWANNVGPGGRERGIRSQEFHSSLPSFVADCMRRNAPVLVSDEIDQLGALERRS